MLDDFGAWVVAGFLIWIVVGFGGLFLLWKTWNSLGQYFTEMERTPWETRSALGWPTENPTPPMVGVCRDLTRTRLLYRLAIWGEPPHLDHTETARRALRKYRVLFWGSLLFPSLLLAAALMFLSFAFLLPVVIGITVLLLFVRPTKWPEVL